MYAGPRGGPGMQEMLYPTSSLKSRGLGKACALVTDGRFSGGSIGLVETGDGIETDIPERRIHLAVSDAELAARRQKQDEAGWHPAEPRPREVTAALRGHDHQRGAGGRAEHLTGGRGGGRATASPPPASQLQTCGSAFCSASMTFLRLTW